MQQALLFCDPISLDGYTPAFNKLQSTLGLVSYHWEETIWEYTDEEPFGCRNGTRAERRYKLVVFGVDLIDNTVHLLGLKKFEVIPKIISTFLCYAAHQKQYPEVWEFLTLNATDLSNSMRYWNAMAHLEYIKTKEQELEEFKEKIEVLRKLSSLNAYEVLQGRELTLAERNLAWVEFNGSLPIPRL